MINTPACLPAYPHPPPTHPRRAGITIGHVLRCHPKPDRWKLKMYFPMLICFFLGAAAGKSAFEKHGRSSLLLPTFFLFAMGWTYIYYLSRIRHQPFKRVLLKRVSDEILTPHSPSNKSKQQKNRLGLPHMPQIHIPFQHHPLRSGHHQQQAQHQQPQQQSQHQQHHSRRHSSACDELGKAKAHGGGGQGGQQQHQQQHSDGERAIVLDIGAPAEAASAADELSNHTAAVV